MRISANNFYKINSSNVNKNKYSIICNMRFNIKMHDVDYRSHFPKLEIKKKKREKSIQYEVSIHIGVFDYSTHLAVSNHFS